MQAATHQSARESGGSPALTVCALLAVAVHAAALFAWRYVPEEPAASAIEGDSI